VAIEIWSSLRRGARFGAAVGLTLVLTACGGDSEAAPNSGGGRGGRGGPGGPPGGRVAPVETGLAETGSIAREVVVSGVVEPIRSVAVNSQLSGALLSVQVEEGARVREGQVLARLDDRELAAQEANAEAAHNVAQAAFERAEQLRERQVITIGEYERDRTAYAAARAQLEQVRTRRGFATVRAPVTGVVLEKRVEAGDVVAPQTRLFTVGDVSTMVVRVPVSELDVVALSAGESARVVLDAFPGRTFSGRIRRVFPSADPATRLVPVEVALEGEGTSVARPGFLARVSFALGARDGVLLVPASAIVSGTGSQAVFVVENGQAVRRTVETGMTSEGRVEILSGLAAGDTVVVTGSNSLRDGAPVRVVAGPGAEAAPGGPPRGDDQARRAPGARRGR
jgi:RND family efflux transporter MFP subunit